MPLRVANVTLLSICTLLYNEWALNPKCFFLLWERLWQAFIDLFAAYEKTLSVSRFFFFCSDPPLALLIHGWPNILRVARVSLMILVLIRVREQWLFFTLSSPSRPSKYCSFTTSHSWRSYTSTSCCRCYGPWRIHWITVDPVAPLKSIKLGCFQKVLFGRYTLGVCRVKGTFT